MIGVAQRDRLSTAQGGAARGGSWPLVDGRDERTPERAQSWRGCRGWERTRRESPRNWATLTLDKTSTPSYYLRMRAGMRAARRPPAPDHVDLAVEVFRMLADATRVQLLWALLDAELPVNELAEAVGKPPAGVSQHLAKLRMARLVHTRRQGTQVFYRIENSHVRQLVEDAIFHAEHSGSTVPDHHRTDVAAAAFTGSGRRSKAT